MRNAYARDSFISSALQEIIQYIFASKIGELINNEGRC